MTSLAFEDHAHYCIIYETVNKCDRPETAVLNYEHRKLRETIKSLDEVPEDPAAFSRWIEATAHLEFLRQNALADELVVHASGDYTFVISLSVPNDRLATVDKGDLRD